MTALVNLNLEACYTPRLIKAKRPVTRCPLFLPHQNLYKGYMTAEPKIEKMNPKKPYTAEENKNIDVSTSAEVAIVVTTRCIATPEVIATPKHIHIATAIKE